MLDVRDAFREVRVCRWGSPRGRGTPVVAGRDLLGAEDVCPGLDVAGFVVGDARSLDVAGFAAPWKTFLEAQVVTHDSKTRIFCVVLMTHR